MKEYLVPKDEVLSELSSDEESGLSAGEASSRLAQYGPNELEKEEKTPLWKRFFEQMADPMVIMLIVAAAISAITGTIQGESEWADVIIIMAVVIINSVLGVVQEAKSEQALEALQQMSAAQSKVIRDGKLTHLPSADLVPGDIVLLEAGDSVPADCRVLESASMKIASPCPWRSTSSRSRSTPAPTTCPWATARTCATWAPPWSTAVARPSLPPLA